MKKFFPHLEKNFSELLEACRGRNIAVVGHMRPDGDCVGSQFALADILASAGAKKTVCLNQNGLPRLYENFAYGRRRVKSVQHHFEPRNYGRRFH